MQPPTYTLRELIVYFLKLGTTGFGGPIALVGYMHRDLVEREKWITEEEYREGLALSQLAPGPLAAQLGIYLGFVHYRLLGATLCGLAFVLPSFIMVVVLGMIYRLYGSLPGIQSVFYGVGAAVTGIILLSSYKLTIKSVSPLNKKSIAASGMLWILYTISAILTIWQQSEELWLFLLAGFLYMVIKAPPGWIRKNKTVPIFLFISGSGFWQYQWSDLQKIGWFFFKAGAFVFGSGLAIVPFLHNGVVVEYGWLSEQVFLDAVAVAMITPGPVVITVGFIGYLVAGFPGAVVASVATFLPCYLFTVIPAPYFKRIAKNRSVKAFVDGITAAVVGALSGAVVVIASRSIRDWPSAMLAVATIILLVRFKKLPEPWLILTASLLGLLVKQLNIIL